MSKIAKDVFGIASVVVATVTLIGLHSWMYVQ